MSCFLSGRQDPNSFDLSFCKVFMFSNWWFEIDKIIDKTFIFEKTRFVGKTASLKDDRQEWEVKVYRRAWDRRMRDCW